MDTQPEELLLQLISTLAKVETKLDNLTCVVHEVKDYQKAQNGKVFTLSDKVTAVEKQLTSTETKYITNAAWLSGIWAIVGGLLVTVGRSVFEVFTK
jgi:capsule polysaccharide export protein KpsE/RkpR